VSTAEILKRLIGFPTVSHESNLDLIGYAREMLEQAGAAVELVYDKPRSKANLYATVGPRDKPGVLLSGHTDVVPVEGQDWSVKPFEATEKDGKVYGRGAADMKGFVAAALRAAACASRRELATPLHIALSHDEEIGCVGVRSLIGVLADAPFRPAMCIVGEPTSLAVVTGHKGKANAKVECVGCEAHSAYAPKAVNAIHLATDLVSAIREIQARSAEAGPRDEAYEIPYTTLHVGIVRGGVALNIVPKSCLLDFEIRNLAGDGADLYLDRVREEAGKIVERARPIYPGADIRLEQVGGYPGLETDGRDAVVRLGHGLAGENPTRKVAYGTEAGLFSGELGIPTIVCGPGSMEQGHKPDEFVTLEQLDRCDAMLDRLLDRLEKGI